jgi:hypothetical protein
VIGRAPAADGHGNDAACGSDTHDLLISCHYAHRALSGFRCFSSLPWEASETLIRITGAMNYDKTEIPTTYDKARALAPGIRRL